MQIVQCLFNFWSTSLSSMLKHNFLKILLSLIEVNYFFMVYYTGFLPTHNKTIVFIQYFTCYIVETFCHKKQFFHIDWNEKISVRDC